MFQPVSISHFSKDKVCLPSGFFQYTIKLSTGALTEMTALMWEPPNLFHCYIKQHVMRSLTAFLH